MLNAGRQLKDASNCLMPHRGAKPSWPWNVMSAVLLLNSWEALLPRSDLPLLEHNLGNPLLPHSTQEIDTVLVDKLVAHLKGSRAWSSCCGQRWEVARIKEVHELQHECLDAGTWAPLRWNQLSLTVAVPLLGQWHLTLWRCWHLGVAVVLLEDKAAQQLNPATAVEGSKEDVAEERCLASMESCCHMQEDFSYHWHIVCAVYPSSKARHCTPQVVMDLLFQWHCSKEHQTVLELCPQHADCLPRHWRLRAGIGAEQTPATENTGSWRRKSLWNHDLRRTIRKQLQTLQTTCSYVIWGETDLVNTLLFLAGCPVFPSEKLMDSHPSWAQRICSSLHPSERFFWSLLCARPHN